MKGAAEALVADPEIDAVFVLTNFETHEHYATLPRNLRQLMRSMLLESQMCTSSADSE